MADEQQLPPEVQAPAVPNGFDQLNPPPPSVATPPQTPEELQNRVSGWSTLLQRLTQDPAIMAGSMRLATQLMQPRPPGQTNLGQFGGALEDSINYVAASRTAAENRAREDAKTFADVGHTQAQTGAITQATSQSAQQFPNALKQSEENLRSAQNNNRKAEYELQQLSAQQASGVNDPAYIKKLSDAKLAAQEATARLYDAHSKYYGLLGNAAENKQQGILHTTKIDNADGTTSIVNTHAKNGQIYYETYTPPRFTDAAQAQLQAQKEVDKITPFFGKAPYSGTKDQEVQRRVQLYMAPKRQILGPGGREVTPEQFQQLDAPAPSKFQDQSATYGEQSGSGGDAAANIQQIQAELAKTTDPKVARTLSDQLVVQLNAQQGRNTTISPEGARAAGDAIQVPKIPPQGGGPINVQRDASGRLQIIPDAQAGENLPEAPKKTYSVEQYLRPSRGGLEFNAPQRAGTARKLNGRRFKTVEEAQQAYEQLTK